MSSAAVVTDTLRVNGMSSPVIPGKYLNQYKALWLSDNLGISCKTEMNKLSGHFLGE